MFLVFVLFCHAYGAIPMYQAASDTERGTGDVTVQWPTHQIGDVALLFVETKGNEAVTLSTPAGFAQIDGSPQYTGSDTRITVFWARATSTNMSDVVVADPGNHVCAKMLTYRGASSVGNPWDVTGGGVNAVRSGSLSLSGVTTRQSDILIVQAATRDLDTSSASFSNLSNGNLTNLTERVDVGTTSGDGGGFAVWDGGKAVTGAIGTTTVDVAPITVFGGGGPPTTLYAVNAYFTIALRPPTTISISNASVTEGNSGSKTLSFPISITNPNSSPIVLTANTADGTAMAGNDYVALANYTVTIPANTSSYNLNVTVNGDTIYEGSETFTVTLSNPTNATITTATATGTITNDDSAPTSARTSCADIYAHGKTSDGYYIIDPDGAGSGQPFEIYCEMNSTSPANSKNVIKLLMPFDDNISARYSNFYFTSIDSGKNYYLYTNGRRSFDNIVIDPSTMLAVPDARSGYYDGNFTNINLQGTPFAVDWSGSTVLQCTGTNLVKGCFDQIVKLNVKNDANFKCRSSNLKLKVMDDYHFFLETSEDSNGSNYMAYPSCTKMRYENVGYTNGHYYIDPDGIGGKRQFLAYCNVASGDTVSKTYFVALDGAKVVQKQDVTSRKDSCSKLGLDFFVPISASTFDRTRQFLLAMKPQWQNYAGTINDMIQAFFGSNYYLYQDGTRLFWPFGPMGIYNPNTYNSTACAGKKMNSFDANNIAGCGFRSAMYDMNSTMPGFWMSEFGAGAGTASGGAPLCSGGNTLKCYLGTNNTYAEPNGNYNPNSWLNYIADDNGNIYHLDDSNNVNSVNGGNEYVYTSYACITYDSYSPDEVVDSSCTSFGYNVSNPKTGTLTTQITGQPFDLKVSVSCSRPGLTIPSRKISLYLADNSAGQCTKGQALTAVNAIDINSSQTSYTFTVTAPYLINDANRSAYIRIETNASEVNCSADRFSVRPSSLQVSSPSGVLRSGEGGALSVSTSSGYTSPSIAINISSWLNPITSALWSCPACQGSFSLPTVNITNGVGTIDLNFSDVGKFLVDINDSTWTAVDQYNDCIKDSNSTVLNTFGLYGCIFGGAAQARFIPYDFNVSDVNVSNFQNGDFTYISGDLNGSAKVSYTVTARNKSKNTTRNYAYGLYEQAVNANIFVNNAAYSGLSLFKGGGVLGGFTSGVKTVTLADANISIFNFSRDYNKSWSPFAVLGTDVNVTAIDTDAVYGDANGSASGKATFLYGRLNATNSVISGLTGSATAYIEVYAPDKTKLPSAYVWRESLNSSGWWVNQLHSGITYGDVNISTVVPAVSSYSSALSSGIVSFALGSAVAPQKSKVYLNVPKWLWYSQYAQGFDSSKKDCAYQPCFDVEFVSAASPSSSWLGSSGADRKAIQPTPTGKRKEKMNR